MFAQRSQVYGRALLISDVVVVAAAYAIAFKIRFPYLPLFGGPTPEHRIANLVIGLTGLVSWPIILKLLGLYSTDAARRSIRTITRLLPAAVLVGLSIGSVLFFAKAQLASRMVLGWFLLLSTVLLWAERMLGSALLRWWGRTSGSLVMIVGSGPAASKLAQRLEDEPELGARLHGFLRAPNTESAVPDDQILGEVDQLEQILDGQVVDQVAIALPSASAGEIQSIAMTCAEVGIDVVVAASEMDAVLARASLDTIGDVPVLRLYGSPQFRAAMISKRVFDLTVTSTVVVALSPLMLAAAALVKATSKGPVLYVQRRVGLNGRLFDLYKFRSMVVDAEARRPELEDRNEMSGPVFKVTADPRVTPVGHFLRRFSLDELPQLLNVLKGEMSLVGPRPPIPDEVAQYDRWQRRRLSVRPGMTGTWQVSGRNEVDFDAWMHLDLGYIDHWSPWLDLKIIAKTIPAVLTGRGAR